MTITYVVLAIILTTILWSTFTYNSIVNLKNKNQEAWSDIDVQFKRRHDLIPNLVETVKGYQKHESGVLTQIVELRNKALAIKSIAEKDQAETLLTHHLGKFFALAESYPDLKASASFIELQKTLTDIEEQIQNARRYYNGVTRDYNTKIQSFPCNIIAQFFHFTLAEFLKLDSTEEKQVIKVSF